MSHRAPRRAALLMGALLLAGAARARADDGPPPAAPSLAASRPAAPSAAAPAPATPRPSASAPTAPPPAAPPPAAPPPAAPRWEWLPGTPRALPFAFSASRDAPVLEYAYGPRAQLGLGHDLGVVTRHGAVSFHLSVAALAALENSRAQGPVPAELGRVRAGLAATFSFDRFARARLGAAGVVEIGFGLGVERARVMVATETDRPLPAPRPGDIPFGGGGEWLAFDAGVRFALRPRFTLALRVAERVFFSAWPLLGGARAASDVVADFLGDGLAHAPSLEVTLAWAARPRVRPLLAAFAEGLFPQDQTARASYFVRGLLGVGLRGAAGETVPFVSLDAGSGQGMLINRHEVRLSAGVRHVF